MADQQNVRIILLFGIGPMKVLSKAGLNSSAILKELLQEKWNIDLE